ncbi:LysM domain-containing protein [Asanoa hainanensis]|uniref:LysM domain-containing protein n=1 Tax=Asanoa hainanensis TaxID=560556 RepID=A0A239MRF7_9ACTN|nr:LysM peptidoglycan-binding domain-containing protein [Asanoa hainanensis]SNT44853.1 LysM domain-containing protein [Asanoa hainanensis]
MTVSTPRRVGQIVTGLGALVLLVGLVGGAPIALLAFAGNPLPDHMPTFAEIGTALTSRDDGQLFVRTLAVLGWLGWGTFAMSVLLELPFRLVRRPTPRLPGLRRQQRMAAALIGSALVLIGSPTTAAIASPSQPMVLHVPARAATATPWATMPERATTTVAAATPASPVGVAQLLPTAAHRHSSPDDEPRYEVERGDYLGAIADRYVGDFGDYPELARLNKIQNPDRIYPGQLLKLPDDAIDHGYRPHASGMVIRPGIDDGHDPNQPPPAQPAQPAQPPKADPTQPSPNQPAPSKPTPNQPAPNQPLPDQPAKPAPPEVNTVPPVLPAPRPPVIVPLPPASPDQNMAAGAPQSTDTGLQINRPLAVSAVIAAAAIVGAQVGTVFGLRRKPAGTPVDGGRHRAEGE